MHILAGKHYKRKLFVPKSVILRPTFSRLKTTLFDILQTEVKEALFLDLFAGAGGMGFEALSRGAKEVVFVEQDKKAARAIHENSAHLGEEKNCTILCTDVFEALKRLTKQGYLFDIIFADPPYGTVENSLSLEVLKFVDHNPLLKKGGSLLLEDAKEASTYDCEPKTLSLKSKRDISKATLCHYITV